MEGDYFQGERSMNVRCNCSFVTGAALLMVCLAVPGWASATGTSARKAKAHSKPAQATAVQGSEEIVQKSSAFFAAPPFMAAEDVYAKVVKEGDSTYFLVSLQPRTEFAKGHVPGAVNLPFEEITERSVLKLLPRDRKIVFTCDDGHRSMMASLYFNQLGYSATAMPMGLSHWNRTESAAPLTGSARYPVSTEKADVAVGKAVPAVSSNAGKGNELIAERTRGVLTSRRKLFMNQNEVYEEAAKDGGKGIFLVSIQRPEDYAKGHVPGAINVPFTELASKKSLSKLPTDRKIVVVCYIGHIAAAATLFLNQLGYEAYDLRFGTLGWNDTTEGLGKMKGYLLSLVQDRKYPVERAQENQ
ncbi:rhodanese-like domain-containing protein [Geomonas sp. RF6]|uniref:rhodanese-like domain-containing protein n=1 Tax=Geomonas sp. RF6 TaxID=2897342 RepID=UPI001E583044|nr:rhodanese-like domain-containing protein [Geomonas sp. RF6]UFS71903.1 rhodanese-like domain-containing protein [Geomonas sp. RF6]